MPSLFENNVLELGSGSGTGAITLAAMPGFRRFADVLTVGGTCHYSIKAVDTVGRPTGAYEYGIGTYTAANTLTRTTPIGSSNAGALVAFAAGDKLVSLAVLAPTTEALRFDWQDAIGLNVAGQLAYFAMSAAPAGWLKANGAAISRATYARLFNCIGTQYGAGDGSTTFTLPDLRGKFVRSWDDGAGIDTSRAFGSFQDSANLTHVHGINDPSHAHSIADPGHAHGAYTDAQGNHTHASGSNPTDAVGPGGYGLIGPPSGFQGSIHMTGMHGGYRTDTQGNHAHNVGIYGAGTGIGIYGSGTGVTIQAAGGNEARPKNVAALACIKF